MGTSTADAGVGGSERAAGERGSRTRRPVPNVVGKSFTVYLSKAVTAATKVAWFVVN